ncbi:MAG: hypothetical protein FJW30_26615 [Acidobacteria bacterium]|nr:hypothetical protein [Acidobacteriota bacterium]
MQNLIQALVLIIPLAAQECRITPLSPAQPANRIEDNERATESQTFQTNALAVSPSNRVHFFDSAFRIRRIEADGRVRTLAGSRMRDEIVPGPALQSPMQNVGQIVFSPAGVLHFSSGGRVFRLTGETIELVAGSGRPGFNGEEGVAADVNLGGIVHMWFAADGSLYLIDGYNRVRRVTPDGRLRTFAGSTRAAAAAGFTGDNGPAAEASLSNPRQVFPLPNGDVWIKDLGGRHLRAVTSDGVIRTINQNFDASINIISLANGNPAAATANRVFPFNARGDVDPGSRPFAPFTGTPLAVGPDSALYFSGGARPEQRNPLVRLTGTTETVVAGGPVAPIVPGQAAPFGTWSSRTNSLFYPTSIDGKAGIVEARAGQAPRFVAGGGTEINEADGKPATQLTIFGISSFTIDGDGRLIIADTFRRRILVVGVDGNTTVLKTQGGDPVVFAPTGTFATLQRLTSDNAGNIYWFRDGATPAGGFFQANINVWNRSTQSVSSYAIPGLSALSRLEDGTPIAIAGNSATFRSVFRLDPAGLGPQITALTNLPLVSVTRWNDTPYFVASSRLFRGNPGELEFFNEPFLATSAAFTPDFVLNANGEIVVHSADGGFYRIDNREACRWAPQPRIATRAIVNAASFADGGVVSPRQLVTVFGSGLGPVEGQSVIRDGLGRATGQGAPWPAITFGLFTGTIPFATVGGTNLPVVYSSDTQLTLMAPATVPPGNLYLVYFGWNGLTLIQPEPIRVQPAVPGLFDAALNQDGTRNSPSNGAAPNTVLQLFATGLGAIDVTVPLGDVNPADPPANATQPVSVTIGGKDADVLFAGGAPGQLGGVYQINIRVPEGLPSGLHPVTLTVGEQSTATKQSIRFAVRN